MKLNQELIDKLAKGEILLQHTGTVEQLREILKEAFPLSVKDLNNKYYHHWTYYHRKKYKANHYDFTVRNAIRERYNANLPIYKTEQFFNLVPDVGKTIDAETRELAKQLFLRYTFNADEPMKLAIKHAKQFIKLLNEQP